MSAAPDQPRSVEGCGQTSNLAPEDVEAIARRVVELLREEQLAGGAPLVDAATVARELGRSRDWVYRHAGELGARRIGDGTRPRLMFDLAEARAAAGFTSKRSQTPGTRTTKPTGRRRAAAALGSGPSLLPIRGRDAA